MLQDRRFVLVFQTISEEDMKIARSGEETRQSVEGVRGVRGEM